MIHCYRLALASIIGIAGSSAQAAQVVLENPDFEQGVQLPDGGYLPGFVRRIPGWVESGGSGTGHWNPTTAHFSDEAVHSQVGYAIGNGTLTQANGGTLAQLVAGHTLRANTRYTLTFDVGRPFAAATWNYAAGLVAGRLSESNILLAAVSGDTDQLGGVVPLGQFRTVKLIYDTGAVGAALGRNLSIAFSSNNTGAAFDNFFLDASPLIQSAVPEPATWAMMIAGFGLVGGAIRRQRAKLAYA